MVNSLRKLNTSEVGMRLREKFFIMNKYSPSATNHFAQAMIRFKECKNSKNKSQIKREIQICRKYWKCYPYHYFIYNLFRADNEVTEEELINYIPHFFWYICSFDTIHPPRILF